MSARVAPARCILTAARLVVCTFANFARLKLRSHPFGEGLRPTEAAITGLCERIDAVGDQSEGHNA